MDQIIQTSCALVAECIELLRIVTIVVLAGTVFCSPFVVIVVTGLLLFAD